MTTAQHLTTGRQGEEIACRYLERKGYTIIDRNVVMRVRGRVHSELDIVARKGDDLIVIEVKTRVARIGRLTELPEAAVTARKIRSTMAGIVSYARSHGLDTNTIHLDVLAVVLDPAARAARVRHLQDVFLTQ